MSTGYEGRLEGLATIHEIPKDGLTESQRIRNHNEAMRKSGKDDFWRTQAISLEEYRRRQEEGIGYKE